MIPAVLVLVYGDGEEESISTQSARDKQRCSKVLFTSHDCLLWSPVVGERGVRAARRACPGRETGERAQLPVVCAAPGPALRRSSLPENALPEPPAVLRSGCTRPLAAPQWSTSMLRRRRDRWQDADRPVPRAASPPLSPGPVRQAVASRGGDDAAFAQWRGRPCGAQSGSARHRS